MSNFLLFDDTELSLCFVVSLLPTLSHISRDWATFPGGGKRGRNLLTVRQWVTVKALCFPKTNKQTNTLSFLPDLQVSRLIPVEIEDWNYPSQDWPSGGNLQPRTRLLTQRSCSTVASYLPSRGYIPLNVHKSRKAEEMWLFFSISLQGVQ